MATCWKPQLYSPRAVTPPAPRAGSIMLSWVLT